MGVVNPAELLELMAEREELEWERQCLLDRLRHPQPFDDIRARVMAFSARLGDFAARLRMALGAGPLPFVNRDS
jgi:hypothetical protein